jgi:hypothetical protein
MTDRLEFGELTPTADANTWQFNFVRAHTTAGTFNLANGASGPQPLGVLQNDPRVLEAGTIVTAGKTKVKADATGSAITYGCLITSGSTGMAIIAAGSTAQGIALQALASGASVLIDIYLYPTMISVIAN